MAAVGLYFSRGQTSLDRYLLAGRSMGWLPVGLSLMAALNSGIDYLMQPSATIRYGLVLLVGSLSWPLLYPWIALVVFPFYRRLNFYTVYEYLEVRFDLRVRTLAAAIFIVWRLGWMATALYVPSLAINAATNGQVDLTLTIVIIGIVVTLYTMLGGIQAVIWNDVLQFGVMFGGLAATVAIVVANVPGGMSEIWSVAAATGKTSLWVPIAGQGTTGAWGAIANFFAEPVTAVAILAAMVVGRMAQYTSDQVMVQRLQTTRSLDDTRHAFIVHAAGDVLWMAGLSLVGLALFAYFRHHPLPAGQETDKLLPYFMSQAFPPGAVGLVIAAILAASLSSIDSAINSCTSVAVVDVYNRLVLKRNLAERPLSPIEQRDQVRVSRMATLIFGLVGTAMAWNVPRIGSLLEIANKLINSFTGPLLGIFLLAMFSRRARSEAALAAGIAGAAASYYVAYHSTLSFLWPSTFGLLVSLLVGFGMLVVFPADADDPRRAFTWHAVTTANGTANSYRSPVR